MPPRFAYVAVCFCAALASAQDALASSTVYLGGAAPGFDTPYTVNVTTGAATLFGSPVGSMEGMSYDSTRGRIVSTVRSDNGVRTIDPVTGAVGLLPGSAQTRLEGLAYDVNSDVFWASDQSSGNLYRMNPVTGTTMLAQPIPLAGGVRIGGLGFNPATNTLYGVDDNRLFAINVTSAPYIPVAVGPAGFGVGFTDVDAVEYDAATGLLYIVNDFGTGGTPAILQQFASLDPSTGLATVIGTTGLPEQFGQGMAIVLVPEPAALLGIAGVGSLLLRGRRT